MYETTVNMNIKEEFMKIEEAIGIMKQMNLISPEKCDSTIFGSLFLKLTGKSLDLAE